MDTRTDIYGLLVTLSVLDNEELYTRTDGVSVSFPIGAGWTRALNVFNGMQPAGWVPPEPPPEVTDASA